MTRPDRVRYGHALLGCVMLSLLLLGAYALLVGTYDPKRNDWSCADLPPAPGATCLDIDYWR